VDEVHTATDERVEAADGARARLDLLLDRKRSALGVVANAGDRGQLRLVDLVGEGSGSVAVADVLERGARKVFAKCLRTDAIADDTKDLFADRAARRRLRTVRRLRSASFRATSESSDPGEQKKGGSMHFDSGMLEYTQLSVRAGIMPSWE